MAHSTNFESMIDLQRKEMSCLIKSLELENLELDIEIEIRKQQLQKLLESEKSTDNFDTVP